jgi:hypothetical protein
MNDVEQFISRFTFKGAKSEVIDTFTNGCCYWFAEILYLRFFAFYSNCAIVYDPLLNHWACAIGDRIYDITGDLTKNLKYSWVDWEEHAKEDNLVTNRLYRDCIYF